MISIRNFILSIILPVVTFAFVSCEDNNVTDDSIPFCITSCIDQYFQGRGMSDYEELPNGNYQFTVSHGPTLVIDIISNNEFNPDFNLISYNGNGETMPQNLAWNKLPADLYNYIDGLESINYIYQMKLAGNIIYITLTDTNIQYNTKTGKITET